MEVIRSQAMPSDVEEDPYAISSDSESEEIKKPPPKIQIGERMGQLNQLKTALTEKKQSEKDAERLKEIEDLKAKNEAKNIKKGFEMGKISVSENAEMAAREKAERDEEKQKIAQASKENYSRFKDKFERLDSTLEENLEEKLKRMEREQIGLGKDGLANALNRFEKGSEDDGNIQREKVEINRSDADRKRIINAFHGGELLLDEGPQDCALCGKRVYPVERMVANRSIYHKNCFRCATCNKKLLPTNYGSHEGKLLCKGHLWEALHPGVSIPADDIDSEEGSASESGDEEFAVTNKPRKVNKNVVKSGGMDISDELAQIRSLKEKKGEFESSVKSAETIEKKSGIDDEIAAGKVKENLGRFVNGANDVSTKIQREELHFDQVGDIKNKWKTGQVETAEQEEAHEKEELTELRGSINVKERFKERTEENQADKPVERSYDASQLNTSLAAEARKSFMEGRAFESSASIKKESAEDIPISGKAKDFKEKFEKGQGDISEVQKTQVEIDGISLDHLKSAFEAKGRSTVNMTPEERAEQKQKEIEAEFLRYKLARKAATKRAQQMADTGEEAHVIGGADAASGVGVGGIRETFNSGKAFNTNEHGGREGSGLDVEVKVAGKARAKFQQLDTNAQPVLPKEQRREPSKWDKKESASGEIVNRRSADQQGNESEEEEFDVKNLMNKFKNIGENDSSRTINSEQRAELEKIRVQAKNLKQQFEQGQEDDHDAEEYRKKEMEVEFERLKRERAEMQQKLQEEREIEEQQRVLDKDEEIGIKAEHASKMAAKWEKIHQKEARKAEKSRMPTKGMDH